MTTRMRCVLGLSLVLSLTACEPDRSYTCVNTKYDPSSTKPREVKMSDKGLFAKSCVIGGNSVGDSCSYMVRSYISEGYTCKEDEKAPSEPSS